MEGAAVTQAATERRRLVDLVVALHIIRQAMHQVRLVRRTKVTQGAITLGLRAAETAWLAAVARVKSVKTVAKLEARLVETLAMAVTV